jgi:hypothetical protein
VDYEVLPFVLQPEEALAGCRQDLARGSLALNARNGPQPNVEPAAT